MVGLQWAFKFKCRSIFLNLNYKLPIIVYRNIILPSLRVLTSERVESECFDE